MSGQNRTAFRTGLFPPTSLSSTPASFAAFDYSQDALDEIGRFFKHTGKAIVALTVKEILGEQIAMKLVSGQGGTRE